ncbi:tetratricopeptide repeat family protein [Blastomonas sp. RAC04]|uniref:tetratricopeptide repeat protein n=1 Tax=Blastomonas sp. RAC04 TaxID=1842535 RepID=UPI000857B4A0|nr:tetratricopeptide repeat protein [Blastomonas sp. RAC04]AOG00648.1 tetratricopeptide repeat family protein [Blastomonas sp. RAC04]
MTLPLISALMLLAAAQTAPGESVAPPGGQPAQPEQPAQPVAAGQSGEAPAQPAGPAAPAFVAPLNDEARFEACMDMATEDPASGIVAANEWLIGGGGYFARHCLGFAYAKDGRWGAAADAFVSAARDAERARDNRAANLWTQAGNAALASGDAALALTYFDAAMARGVSEGLLLGELHLDRARALVVAGKAEEAEAAFAEAHRLVPEDPLAWLLSATLARRQGKLDRAQADIDIATRLAPRDPEVALEAGNIAASAGKYDIARRNWTQAIDIRPDGPIAKTARNHLTQLDEAEAGAKGAEPAKAQ